MTQARPRVQDTMFVSASAVLGLAAGWFEEALKVLAKYSLGVNSAYAVLLKRLALSVEHPAIPAAWEEG